MGDILFELEAVLRTKIGSENIKPSEEQLLYACKQKGVLDSVFAAVGSSVLVNAATRKLNRGLRLNLSLGSAFVTGMWRFDSSLNGCLDHILKIEGSRIQKELAAIIITKHGEDSSRMELVNKYFIREQVFMDSSPDEYTFRWRHRNFDGDSASETSEPPKTENKTHEESNQQLNRPNTAHEDLFSDPLDHIFGYSESGEVGHAEDSELPRRRARRQRKVNRRRRALQTVESNNASQSLT